MSLTPLSFPQQVGLSEAVARVAQQPDAARAPDASHLADLNPGQATSVTEQPASAISPSISTLTPEQTTQLRYLGMAEGLRRLIGGAKL